MRMTLQIEVELLYTAFDPGTEPGTETCWCGEQVEQVNFDPVLCVLRIKGKNIMESQHVRVSSPRLFWN